MAKMDLKLANYLVRGANSQAGNGYLEYYEKHRVYHPGWDVNVGYGNQDLGLPVTCPAQGQVVFVSRKARNGGFGLHMVIFHPRLKMYSHWLHLDKVLVKKGDIIKSGQHIANVGNTGTGYAHLHLEVYTEAHQHLMKSRNYRFYPSRQARSWVKARYVNPATFVKKGLKEAEQSKVEPNVVEIDLYKNESGPEIYVIGKVDGKFHHIQSESVFKILFGGFDGVRWTTGPRPSKRDVGEPIQ